MTNRQRIIDFLQTHPNGIDDDELARELAISRRQQVNMRCRELEAEGLVIRRQVNGKIHNFLSGKSTIPASLPETITSNNFPKNELWFWEGNIQSKVVKYLASMNFQIRSVADTANHQQGIDIVAEREGNSYGYLQKVFQ